MRAFILVSSLTGNTRLLAVALGDVLGLPVFDDDALQDVDLTHYDTAILGFWCDRGMAPETMQNAAKQLTHKKVLCFATMGGDPTTDGARQWMQRTSEALVGCDRGNELLMTALFRGRIDPVLFDRMTAAMGGKVDPEREARRKASETHPDRLDVLALIEQVADILNNTKRSA